MSTANALSLVNRVLVKAREDTRTSFQSTDDLQMAVLAELNQAVRIVLDERTWSFQHRTDGVLVTKAVLTVTNTANLTSGFDVSISSVPATFVVEDFRVGVRSSVVFTGDASYGDTAFDLATATLPSQTLVGTLSNLSPHGDIVDGPATVFSYQYTLPSTRKAITRVWHQERDIDLFQEDEVEDFRRLVPRPHESVGSDPEICMAGGTIVPTASSGTGTPVDALRIWPVPSAKTVLNYSYLYRYADLTTATQTLDNVPITVEDDIVQLAFARQLQSIQNDLQRGATMEDRVMRDIDRKHRNMRFDQGRARTLKSIEEIHSRPTALHRTFHSVPGF